MTTTRRGIRIGLAAAAVYALLVAVPIARDRVDHEEIFPFYSWALFSRVPGPEQTGYGVRIVRAGGTTFDTPIPIEDATRWARFSPTVNVQIQELGQAVDDDGPEAAASLRRRFEDSALRGRDVTYEVVWRRWNIRDHLTCDCDIETRPLVRWETTG